MISMSREWYETPYKGTTVWVTPPKIMDGVTIAARLQPNGGMGWKMVVAGRSRLTGHVVETKLDYFPTLDQRNAMVRDAEEVLHRYLTMYEYNMRNHAQDDDEDGDE